MTYAVVAALILVALNVGIGWMLHRRDQRMSEEWKRGRLTREYTDRCGRKT